MGRDKGNRTKNNAKPSSSARSAELLGTNATTSTLFGLHVPKSSTTNDETIIDVNFQLVFKKLNKKDAITKQKALQEFAELLQNCEAETLKSILPLWPRPFNQLSVDTEHRVREALHQTHKILVGKARKNLAPYLKQIIGPWFMGQFDSYSPAASAAVASFQEVFSASKLTEVVDFCQTEILNYIFDAIIVETPQSLSAPNMSTEEVEAKYLRLLISCLQGYPHLLSNLTESQMKECQEMHNKLLTAPKFIKLHQHKDPLIRQGFYKVVLSVLQKASFLFETNRSKITSILVGKLDETDVLVLPLIWEACVFNLVSNQDCWAFINFEKTFFPKLLHLVRKGAVGCANTICPLILPLINKMPSKVFEDTRNFYNSLFGSFKLGLKETSIKQSPSECKIFVSTFIECFKYSILTNRKDEQFCQEMMGKHVLDLIETADSSELFQFNIIIYHIAELLNFFHRNENDFEKLVNYFWNQLRNILKKRIEDEKNTDEELCKILNGQVYFLTNIKSPEKLIKAAGRVKFVTNQKEESENKESPVPGYFGKLEKLCEEISTIYFERYLITRKEIFLTSIINLPNFATAGFTFESTNPMEFFETILSEKLSLQTVIPLCFNGLKNLSDCEQTRLLSRLQQISAENSEFVQFCKVARKFKHLQPVVDCLKSQEFSENYLQLILQFAEAESDYSSEEVILSFLCAEPLVANDTVCRVLDIFKNNLNHQPCVSLLSKTISLLGGSKICGSEQFESLLSKVFQKACSAEDPEELISVFSNGIRTLEYLKYQYGDPSSWQEFTERLSDCVQAMVLYDELESQHVVTLILKYAEQICDISLDNCLTNDDFNSVLPVVWNFMKTPSLLSALNKCLKALVVFGGEMKGICDSTYFLIDNRLEEIEGEFEDSQIKPEDWKKIRELRRRYLESRQLDETSLSKEGIRALIRWHTFTSILCWKLCSMRPNQIQLSLLSSEENPDVIKRTISDSEKEELENFKTKIDWCLEDYENYGGNLLLPLGNEILDLFENSALIWCFSNLYTTMDLSKYVKENSEKLRKSLDLFILSLHPEEFDFFYSAARMLTFTEKADRLLLPKFKKIFSRNFLKSEMEVTKTFVEKTVREVIKNSSDVNVVKLTFWTTHYGHYISVDQWAEIFIVLDNLLDFSDISYKKSSVKLVGHVGNWFLSMKKSLVDNLQRSEKNRLNPEVCKMWREVAEKQIWSKLYDYWLSFVLSEKAFPDIETQITFDVLSSAVVSSICLDKKVQIDFESEHFFQLLRLANVLLSNEHSLQKATFEILKEWIPFVTTADENRLKNCDDSVFDAQGSFAKSVNTQWCCRFLDKALHKAEQVVEALMLDFKLGDTCAVEPFTDSFIYTYGFLLIWRLILTACAEANPPLRFQYASWLKENGHVNILLSSVFKLMPAAVLHSSVVLDSYLKLFDVGVASSSVLNLPSRVTSELIAEQACLVYRLVVQHLPVVVREWWTDAEGCSPLISRVTAAYVSPLLIAQELGDVHGLAAALTDDKFTVTVYPSKREIVGTYAIDEAKMNLLITLPSNYPLGTIKVDSENQAIDSKSFRLSIFFIHRNGSIRDALALWKSDLDKKFDGLDECEICFAIFHGHNFEVPKQLCKVCRKKFHSYCLYKWFSTSNKSTCPNCRNQF